MVAYNRNTASVGGHICSLVWENPQKCYNIGLQCSSQLAQLKTSDTILLFASKSYHVHDQNRVGNAMCLRPLFHTCAKMSILHKAINLSHGSGIGFSSLPSFRLIRRSPSLVTFVLAHTLICPRSFDTWTKIVSSDRHPVVWRNREAPAAERAVEERRFPRESLQVLS